MRTILLLFPLITTITAIGDQSIAIKGKLMCGEKQAPNVRVKLWEEHLGPIPDTTLDQGYTDANGHFNLKGGTFEITPIDPVFKIYHNCDKGLTPGYRKIRFKLPKSYITNEKIPKKTFDIGTLNLETVFAEEERELIVS